MKALLIVLLAFASATAEAASLEETYLAARNQYIAKFKKLEVSALTGDALSKQEKQALSDLEQQLRRIIGDIAIRGFSSQGKTNLDTLSTGDVGFGQLDGLAFSSRDGKAQLVVTTETLLHDWLRSHKNWWKKEKNAPQKVEDALKSEPFYTQAISADAAVFKYAERWDDRVIGIAAEAHTRQSTIGMRVYGPRDIAYVRGDRDGVARLLASRSLLFHRELFEVPFRHADREACTLPQLAIF